MGLSTIPDDYGDDCLCCWSEGQTPLAAYVSYEGIISCNPDDPGWHHPLNRCVKIIQDPGDPCYWFSVLDVYLFAWAACDGINNGCFQTNEAWDTFKGWQVGNCDTYFNNTLICGAPFEGAEDGNAAITWNTGPNDHSIGSLLSAINMEPDVETKFEFWPASSERICVRFARKKDATNILILVEPTEL